MRNMNSISETTNEVEVEFYKWLKLEPYKGLEPLPKANPQIEFEALMVAFAAGWDAHKKATALVFKLPKGYLDEEDEDETE